MGRRATGSIITKPGTDLLYIRYTRDGKKIQEPTGTADRVEAQRLLAAALGKIATGTASPVGAGSLTYEELRAAYIAEKPSRAEYAGLQHLDKYFAGLTVKSIDAAGHVEKFFAVRRRARCIDATIRRNLNPLKAMYQLALSRKKIAANDVPYFPSLKDSDAAGQYISPAEFSAILAALPTAESVKKHNDAVRAVGRKNGGTLTDRINEYNELRPFFTFMYATGCRLGAAQKIRWEMVSKDGRVLNLPGEIMKSGKPLKLVLDGPMLSPIASELKKRFRRENEDVFDSTNYRPEWAKACSAAGLRGYDAKKRVREGDGGYRIHDLRCSGAMNLLQAGVPESTVLKIGGWKTRAMLDRYNVPTEGIIGDAMVTAGEWVAKKIAASK